MNLTEREKYLLIKGASILQPFHDGRGGPDECVMCCYWCFAEVPHDQYKIVNGRKMFYTLSESEASELFVHDEDCELAEYNALIERIAGKII